MNAYLATPKQTSITTCINCFFLKLRGPFGDPHHEDSRIVRSTSKALILGNYQVDMLALMFFRDFGPNKLQLDLLNAASWVASASLNPKP